MVDTAAHIETLIAGPMPRVPERVTETTILAGRHVIVNEAGVWRDRLIATDNPYWYDEETHVRWLPGHQPPDGGDPGRARLHVAVCTERDYHEFRRTKRRPLIVEFPAYLVWAEGELG